MFLFAMWTFVQTPLDQGRIVRFDLRENERLVAYADAIKLLQHDADFRLLVTSALSASHFSAYRWETPPVTTATSARPFEFVLIDTPELDRPADPDAFAEHFPPGDDRQVVAFPNLGNDAVLVVPRPLNSTSAYPHLAAFLRTASDLQKHELWQTVGEAVQTRIGPGPVWLSTAGMGVPWLHLRIDSRPKYYAHAEYR